MSEPKYRVGQKVYIIGKQRLQLPGGLRAVWLPSRESYIIEAVKSHRDLWLCDIHDIWHSEVNLFASLLAAEEDCNRLNQVWLNADEDAMRQAVSEAVSRAKI